jgi:N-acyl-D-aspartate/D-glutamate deacylase
MPGRLASIHTAPGAAAPPGGGVLVWLSAVVALAASPLAAQQSFDVLIRGGRVLDGTGNPWYYADLGVTGDRIVAVGTLANARAATVIDATGLVVSPGFIDAHSHSGGALATPELRGAVALLTQGITTVLVNPDGGGPIDLARQKEGYGGGLGVNVALMVPHGSVRGAVLGSADRAPNAGELDRMRALVRAGMEAGAFGLSSGPFYAPGSFSKTDELVELAKVAAAYGGAYSSHIRDESDYSIGLVAAVDEVITVAREARLPGVVTHIKALGPRVWGYSAALVQRIDRARAQGIEVYADQYPYDASQTGFAAALLPRWAEVGGPDALTRRLADPETLARIRAEVVQNLDRRGGAARIRFGGAGEHAGRTLADVAAARKQDPVDAAFDILRRGGGGGSIISFNMHEDDIRLLMKQPWTMTASDGELPRMDVGFPHPRAYGTFPRKLAKYVREERLIDLEHAVRSMTSLPATVFRMADRGVLRAGAMADIVVFDLDRIADRATYDQPHQLSEGIVHALVGGRLSVHDSRVTGALNGRVLDRRH